MFKSWKNYCMHLKLSSDETFLKKYVAESTDIPELVAVVDADAGNKKVDRPGSQKFKWNTKATKYFIEMYTERKGKFRDRKKSLFFGKSAR